MSISATLLPACSPPGASKDLVARNDALLDASQNTLFLACPCLSLKQAFRPFPAGGRGCPHTQHQATPPSFPPPESASLAKAPLARRRNVVLEVASTLRLISVFPIFVRDLVAVVACASWPGWAHNLSVSKGKMLRTVRCDCLEPT